MKIHYFNQKKADKDDIWLSIAIDQGYVPATCLLGGETVMNEVNVGNDPCEGCNCDRSKCQGRIK